MRFWLVLTALMLSACGQTQTPAATGAATAGDIDFGGNIIAEGADFRLHILPEQNAISLTFPDNDQVISAPYVAPAVADTNAVFQTGGMTITLTSGGCFHDEAVYPMRAHVEVTNARPVEGCAVMRWDHNLLELMPQIDACIAPSPGTRWVTYAGYSDEGTVYVRLQGNGQAVDCMTSIDVAPPRLAPRQADHFPSDGDAVFVRKGDSDENPGGECYEAPEVRSESGELLGWMMDPEGC